MQLNQEINFKIKSFKRTLDTIESPLQLDTDRMTQMSRRLNRTITKKKLSFLSTPELSKVTPQTRADFEITSNVDENSCDSGYSDNRDEFDAMLTDNDTSFDALDSLNSKFFNANSIYNQIESNKNFFEINTDNQDSKLNDISKSLNEVNSESYECNRLIGDLSTNHILPILSKSKHNDLASITSDTLVDLIRGTYDDKIGHYLILDARYPYEYQGGHINCAETAYDKEALFDRLFKEPLTCQNGKQVVLVFHCEFSTERGPKLMREIRERDRLINKDNYPTLCYPEIYLLEGGYKDFFQSQDVCFY